MKRTYQPSVIKRKRTHGFLARDPAWTLLYWSRSAAIYVRKDAGIKTIRELNDPKFTYAILNVPQSFRDQGCDQHKKTSQYLTG